MMRRIVRKALSQRRSASAEAFEVIFRVGSRWHVTFLRAVSSFKRIEVALTIFITGEAQLSLSCLLNWTTSSNSYHRDKDKIIANVSPVSLAISVTRVKRRLTVARSPNRLGLPSEHLYWRTIMSGRGKRTCRHP